MKSAIMFLCLSWSLTLFAGNESVEFKLLSPKESYEFYEYITVTVKFTNKSGTNLAIPEDALTRSAGFRIYCWNKNMKWTEESITRNNWAHKRSEESIVLPPNGYVCRSFLPYVRNVEAFSGVIRHKVWASIDIDEKKYQTLVEKAAEQDAVLWTGKLRSNTVVVDAVAPTADEDKELLRKLLRLKEERAQRTDVLYGNVMAYFKGDLRIQYQDHRAFDYSFWGGPFTRHGFDLRCLDIPRSVSTGEINSQILRDYVAELERTISKFKHEPSMSHVVRDLRWRKSAVLYALGHEMEAQRIKEDLMSEDTDRIFYFELKHLAVIMESLKLELEYAQKLRDMHKEGSQKVPVQSNLRKSQEEKHIRTKHDNVSDNCAKTTPGKEECSASSEMVRKSNQTFEDGQSPKSSSRTGTILFICLGLIAIGMLALFVFKHKRER